MKITYNGQEFEVPQEFIDALQNSIATQLKTEKYELKGGDWLIDAGGDAYFEDSDDAGRNFGTERQTKEQAIEASKQMRRFNRMLAWVAEHDDGWRANWGDEAQRKYFVYYDYDDKRWGSDWDDLGEDIKVYMSEKNVIELRKQLNEGIFDLDGGAE